MRAFIFSVWVAMGKSANRTIDALEKLTSQHYAVVSQGGRQMVAATVQGKSFSYELPEGMNSARFAEQAYEAWKVVSTYGSGGGAMSDDELKAYLESSAGNTRITRMRVSPHGGGRGRYGY